MKSIKIGLLASLTIIFTACGGGGGGSGTTGTNNSTLSFKNQDITTMNSVAVTKNNLSAASSSKVYSS